MPRLSAVASLAEVDAICRLDEPVRRNLRITQAYHELSAGLAARAGTAANWCTFATWASKQAGQTIRGQDLARALEAALGGAEEIGAAVTRLGDALGAVGRVADRSVLLATVRDAVGEALEEARERPADHRDRGHRVRAEQMLLANLRIGLHEQTRLQPEIARALDAPVAHPGEVKARLLARLLPDAPGLIRRLEDGEGRLDDLVQRLVDAVRRRVRGILTEHFMTLELPGGRVRLGRDLLGACPPALAQPKDAELCELLARIDPTPASAAGSGAHDWANLAQRMHFIGELFRVCQKDARLLGAPFEPEQVRALREGHLPDGRP